jgi:hypothetical protein
MRVQAENLPISNHLYREASENPYEAAVKHFDNGSFATSKKSAG